jgi:hypothetical protein
MTNRLCIASWIVLDTSEEATDFPSVGWNSSRAAFQLVYWRCIATFFATSCAHNPDHRHVLFSNADVARVAPAEIVRHLLALGVEFRRLPITYRLPSGSVTRWGNQFYVLNVIRDFAGGELGEQLVLVDSDCIVRQNLGGLAEAIVSHRCLAYTLRPHDQKNYEHGQLLNGMSHARMAAVLEESFGTRLHRLPFYHGGEFFAATRAFCAALQPHAARLWERAVAEASMVDSIKEEAHFLSILMEANSVEPYSANDVIRRIWTNFEDQNTVPDDARLSIWHVPAEKKYGIRRLWQHMEHAGLSGRRLSGAEINQLTSRFIGVPRRNASKWLLDVTAKFTERAALLRGKLAVKPASKPQSGAARG